MTLIKNIIKRILGQRIIKKLSHAKSIYIKYKGKEEQYSLLKCIINAKVIKENSKTKQYDKLFKRVRIGKIRPKDKLYYYIDIFTTLYAKDNVIGNLTIDYEQVLEENLDSYLKKIEENKLDKMFYNTEKSIIEYVETFLNRTIKNLRKQKCSETIINNLNNIKDSKAKNFREALQRILFFNQLIWQSGHFLNGLGRLDLILEPYYSKDLKENIITRTEAKELIKEFLIKLNKDYYFKSNSLSGDTGQIIEIGGININGEYQCNELSYMFIDIIKELQLPDPKLLLRVSEKTPRELVEKALKCIQTGIGCPLLANDDVIIKKLIDFGYDKNDSYNYVTSACWEPFFAGKSLDQNNEEAIIFIKPLQELMDNEIVDEIKDFKELVSKYKIYLEKYLKELINNINKKKYERAPLLSLFYEDSIKKNKDISEGGANYNNTGFTGVGLANLINSLININQMVFINKDIKFCEVVKILKNNFENDEDLLKNLKIKNSKYGMDKEEVIELVNEITQYASSIILQYKNQFGGKYKYGLSAPSYIENSKNFPASFDGRKNGEPFAVHISSDISNAYTELFQFASKLDYGENRFNGNVIDFFVSPTFIEDNFEKFVDFMILSIKLGFFEMQMNVISSETLIEARKNPDKFPNLIVRVWGFSSYFNDLPEEYKEYIIERALKSEGNNY